MKISELLIDETKWTRGALAKRRTPHAAFQPEGVVGCGPDDAEACQWCLIGAVIHCTPKPTSENTYAVVVDEGQREASLEVARVGTRIAETIKKLYPMRVVGLHNWGEIIAEFNDSPGTCFEDVRQVIETADV